MRFAAGSSPRRKANRKTNPEGSMTLMEHLYELRNRLFVALSAIAVGGILGFIWWGVSPFGVPSLGDLLTGPYCALPSTLRLTPNGRCQLLQTAPFEVFTLRMQVGVAAGAVVTAPIWIYQIWAFITPGLYAKERKFALTFVGTASALFAAGAVLAYYVVPRGLSFLANLGGGQFITALTGESYVSFLLTMLAVFGLTFELPLLVVMLNRVGVLPYEKLKRWQRGILFGLFVVAAVATPGNDPISMLALAFALVVLFEAAVLIARAHDRAVARRRVEQGWDDLDPDEPSPLDHQVEPVPPDDATPRYDDAT
ncbi:MAG: twin-arginine translocase subunit TatC [Pseudonocardiales bacterium]|nr:twin-arginine translocase subunit TatC [Pseudonocardiales bacterium]MBV9030694.1 twin-arginine translocase subunit TatC [Pseudonocardiales bacterium]MBW0010865.1 twin-arginine translocase subunit TatC [Pseudonocardiales bacterium]